MPTKQKEAKTDRKYEVINGQRFEYPCYKKGHVHTINCGTQKMWDALSEEVYSNFKTKSLTK